MIALRPFQEILMDKIRAALKRSRHILLVLSTGGGKTVLAAFMTLGSSIKGKRVMFTCHRDFLLDQTAEAFDSVGIKYTFIAAGRKYDPKCNVVIASIDTLKRRYETIEPPDVLIIDEALHVPAAGWSKVVEHYQSSGCLTIGLCACPQRASGEGLGKWFKEIVEGPPMTWLIENGYLSKYKIFAPSKPDLVGLHKRAGEYITEEITDRMNKPSITGNAIAEYKKIADGKQGVAFCCSIKHSQAVCQAFNDEGIIAVHIGSDTHKEVRQKMLKAFIDGRVKILTSVDIFSEGFNLPVVQYGALLRPTMSLNIYLQQLGRILRAHPDKDYAYIADHANNVATFGMPDEIREWTLSDREKNKRDSEGEKSLPVRQCSVCFFVHKPAPVCPNCGNAYPVQAREITEIDGELKEIEIQQQKKEARMEVGKAKTMADLQRIAKERGYASGWCYQMARVKGIKA